MLASTVMNTALPPARAHWLPYVQLLDARALDVIDLVVIHCTELPDLPMAREFGERTLYASGTGNSGHFYIDRDGSIEQYVPLDRIAHHVRGYNPRSIGIELVNTGRWPHWLCTSHQTMAEPYTSEQMTALTALLLSLQTVLPGLHFIAGHEDLDKEHVPASDDATVRVTRKRDPGPQFDWGVIRGIALERLQPQ